MNAAELQRDKSLLLEKREGLLAGFDTKVMAPAARAAEGDTMARADAEADVQISLRQADTQTLREVEAGLARINEGFLAYLRYANSHCPKVAWGQGPWIPICRKCEESIA